MADDDEAGGGWSRRTVLRGLGLGAVAAATVGCGALPRLIGEEGRHLCNDLRCRYWRPPSPPATGAGHCVLGLREAGGDP